MSRMSVYAFLAICSLSEAQTVEGGGAQPPGAPALFVIDSANTLYSFDARGKSLQKMVFKTSVGTLNGGMTLAMGLVYLTYVKAADQGVGGGVFAFDATTLRQVRLHVGAFTASSAAGDPGVMRAIVYNPRNGHFHVATDRLGLLAFDRAGQYIPRPPESTSSMSAVAYDSAHATLWGIADHAVVWYGEESNSPLPGFPAAHAFDGRGRQPLALGLCSTPGDGTSPVDAIAVAFANTKPGRPGTGQSYDRAGKPIGASYSGKIINPHGLSCSSRGEVFIAADNGLLEYTLQGAVLPPAGDLQQQGSPMFGVLAAY